MGLFDIFSRRRIRYNVWSLVNRRVFTFGNELGQPVQIISDIDKTYLDTAFESLGGLAKIALETADEKKSIEGARDFLRHLKWGSVKEETTISNLVPLHFVSSSPPQLRSVLEEKISMDGLKWSSDSFKDQIYNIKKGKLNLLKHQVSYKMASILSLCSQFTGLEKLLLIGDNAETDPYIYFLVKFLLSGDLSQSEVISLLTFLNVPEKIGKQIFEKCGEIPQCSNVDILIRKIPGKSASVPKEIRECLNYFDDYTQASVYAHGLGYLSLESVFETIISYHNFYGADLLFMIDGFSDYLKKHDYEVSSDLLAQIESVRKRLDKFSPGSSLDRKSEDWYKHSGVFENNLEVDELYSIFERWVVEEKEKLS